MNVTRLRAKSLLKQSIIKAATRTAAIERTIEQMKGVLTRSWRAESQESIIEAIRIIEQNPNITKTQLKLIEQNLSQQLGTDFAAQVHRDIVPLNETSFRLGAQAATKHTGVTFQFGLSDQQSLNTLNQNLRFWVGEHYTSQVRDGVNVALQDFFTGEGSRKTLIDGLVEQFGTVFDRADSYWDMLADHTATKTREIGRVHGYEQAEIKRVEFRAHIDDRTTEICRRMNGKILEVETARKKVDEYETACKSENPNSIKGAWKWWTDEEVSAMSEAQLDRKIKRGEIFFPPLHARCRSITVAFFGD